ncbi:MAG: ATP-binding protein, partial [Flavobacteriaceae bacterium]|nr:ATP-binding protein [Flavobacteriaceae bacterium]
LNGLTIPSLLFLAGILFVIMWVLRSFYWQSRLITTTNDFINALNNLWDNAKTYSEQPEINLIVTRTKDQWLFCIVDNGPGMFPEQQERMFEKYYRGNQNDTHRVKGYGLGLSYVQNIIKAHKGRIKVESAPGQGTKVCLSLRAYDA